jgi:two-component system, chemotaxis family, response regulator Rcp1
VTALRGGGRERSGILLVEGEPGDVRLVREAIAEALLENPLFVSHSGEDALAFLRGSGARSPGLILLDLDIQEKGGLAVVAEIKSDPALRFIPVVVLGASRADQDIQAAYELGANSYVIKPVGLLAFFAAIESILTYWLAVASLPPDH